VRLLLDTHAALWYMAGSGKLAEAAREQILVAERVYVSVASVWEIEIKRAQGKLDAPADLAKAFTSMGFMPLDIDLDHAVAAARLPKHHQDPFDRMIIAQAQLEALTIVTADAIIPKYDVPLLAAG
jgi:PIN domain nuclease of toxin-antitoxin system